MKLKLKINLYCQTWSISLTLVATKIYFDQIRSLDHPHPPLEKKAKRGVFVLKNIIDKCQIFLLKILGMIPKICERILFYLKYYYWKHTLLAKKKKDTN